MKPIVKAREELEKARLAIEEMKIANNLKSYKEAWELFLIRLERVWNKLCNDLSRSPKYRNWTSLDKAKQLRKDDPLLSYLTNARGVSEHTIEDITEIESGGIAINPAIGNHLHIEHMHINHGNIFIKSKQRLKIEFIPGKLKLKQVSNRSATYNPPSSHLGQPLKITEPANIAEIGLIYYENLIKEAEGYFVG